MRYHQQKFTLWTTTMSAVSSIQFTQDQVRALTGVSVEAARHWRKAVRYLSTKTGKVARYSFTDVVALAVTSDIVHSLGVHIGTVSAGIDALFHLLGKIGAASLDGSIVLVTSTDAILYKIEGDVLPLSAPAVVVPLTPFVARIQRQMMPTSIGPMSAVQDLPQKLQRKA